MVSMAKNKKKILGKNGRYEPASCFHTYSAYLSHKLSGATHLEACEAVGETSDYMNCIIRTWKSYCGTDGLTEQAQEILVSDYMAFAKEVMDYRITKTDLELMEPKDLAKLKLAIAQNLLNKD